MDRVMQRRVELETCQNFRDLGGYTTRDGRRLAWGRLFRADTLHRMTAADLEVMARLEIRTVIDLRASDEVERHGRITVGTRELTYHHLPMLDRVSEEPPTEAPAAPLTDLGSFYIRTLGEAGEVVAQAVELLSRPEALPAVFHCMAGKDRTGILAAAVLGCLGVDDEQIVFDYVLTEEGREARSAFLSVHDPEYLAYLDALPPAAMETRAESMQVLLDHVRDEYGSMDSCLRHLGVGAEAIGRLADALLED